MFTFSLIKKGACHILLLKFKQTSASWASVFEYCHARPIAMLYYTFHFTSLLCNDAECDTFCLYNSGSCVWLFSIILICFVFVIIAEV